jgi:hypothetical protein
MEAIKDGATKRINRSRRETGEAVAAPLPFDPLRAGFDRALGTVEEYNAAAQGRAALPAEAPSHGLDGFLFSLGALVVKGLVGGQSVKQPGVSPGRLLRKGDMTAVGRWQ